MESRGSSSTTTSVQAETVRDSIVAGRDIILLHQPFTKNRENGVSQGKSLQDKLKEKILHASFQNFDPVPLQISEYEEESNQKQYDHDPDLEPQIDSMSKPTSVIDAQDLFLKASPTIFSVAGNESHSFVGVMGEPGVGKTTLAKNLLKTFSKPSEETEAGNQSFLFYIPLKNVNYDKEINILTFLASPLIANWSSTEDQTDQLLKEINDSVNVYIFFDGLDEAPENVSSSEPVNMNLSDLAKPAQILANIFSGRLLPLSKKLVTSRPEGLMNLHPKCRPQFNVRVLGLDKTSQKSLIKQLCSNTIKLEAVETAIKTNPELHALCHVPLFCILIANLLHESSATDQMETRTLTSILSKTFYKYVRSGHSSINPDVNPAVLLSIARLAFNETKKSKYVFELEKLPKEEKENLKDFLLVDSPCKMKEKIFSGDKTFFFTHRLWQDFFAAVHLMFFSDPCEFRNLLPALCKRPWQVVLKFAFGCTNTGMSKLIGATFSQKPNYDDFAKRVRALSKCYLRFDRDEFDSWKPFLLAFEAADVAVTKTLSDNYPPDLVLKGPVSLSAAFAVSYVFQHMPLSPRKIFWGHDTLLHPSMKEFAHSSLKTLLHAANKCQMQVKKFAVADFEIGADEADGIAQQMNNIEILLFSSCSFTDESFHELCCSLKEKSLKLKSLTFMGHKFNGQQESDLTSCLQKVDRLDLRYCKVSDAGLKSMKDTTRVAKSFKKVLKTKHKNCLWVEIGVRLITQVQPKDFLLTNQPCGR